MAIGHTRVVQITNIAPQATKDQMQTLFGYLGKIDDIRLYPTIRDVSCPVQSRICYVKYQDSACVGVAQHLTNTVFIDRALIVIPITNGEIPDEMRALEMSNNGTLVPGLQPLEPKLPVHVVNRIEGIGLQQIIQTDDPRLLENGLPAYPPLPAGYDTRKVEEIRRTVLAMELDPSITPERIMKYFSNVGEIKYIRMCIRDSVREKYALIEFSEQESIISALLLHGSEIDGHVIKVFHSPQAIVKPETKTNEAAQREIEEAMCRVKEAQNLISAAIDPVIGMLSKDKSSSSRRTRSRSRDRRRTRSRSRRRSRSHRRSRSRTRKRSHSRSKRSRSRSKRSRSKSRQSRSRDRKKRSKSRRRSRSKSRSERNSRVHRSRSKSKTKSSKRDKERVKDKERDREKDKKRYDVERAKDKRSKRSRSKVRSGSVERRRSRSRDRKRSKTPSKSSKSSKRRSHSRESKRRSKLDKDEEVSAKVPRNYDEEEKGFENDDLKEMRHKKHVESSDESARGSIEKDKSPSDNNMDISNSP